MINEWNFPHNGYGQVRGVSDAGIETFTGTEQLNVSVFYLLIF